MEQQTVCPHAFLTEVTMAIERHLPPYGDPEKWISYASLAELVNRAWRGTGVRFTADGVKKAVRELQAIDTLELHGRDSEGILVMTSPERPPASETYSALFHGYSGSYDNPSPLPILKQVHEAVPLPARCTSIAAIASRADFSLSVTNKALRELKLINVLNYIVTEPFRIKILKKRPHVSQDAYESILGGGLYAQ